MTNPRSRLHAILPALLLAAVGVAGVAAADNPGMTDVDVGIHTPLGDFDPAPIPVQNPVIGNVIPDLVDKVAPLLGPTDTDVGNTPTGQHVDPPLGLPPVQTDEWGYIPGIGPRSFEPLKTLLDLLNKADDTLPVDIVDVDVAASEGGTLRTVFGVDPDGILAGDGGPLPNAGGDKPEVVAPFDEASMPHPVYDAVTGGATAPYEPRQALGMEQALSEAAASTIPDLLERGSTLAFVLAAGLALLAFKLLVPLYHRFKRKTALDNPTRGNLYALLREAPGLSAAELSERSGLHVTTVKYHLDVLRKVGMVGEQSVDGTRRFYSYENGDRFEFLTRALLDEPAARAIYEQIESHPGKPFIEVSRGLGMRKEHVHYHVKKLARHGLIADRWVDGRRLLYPAGHADVGPARAPAPLAAEVPA